MNGVGLVAVLVAAAVLASPSGSGHRLRQLRFRRAARHRGMAVRIVGPLVVLAVLVGVTALPPAAVSVIAVSAVMVQWRRSRRAAARGRRAEGRAMAAALEVLVGELRVGAHPAGAFGVAAAESGGTVGRALGTVAIRARLGADVVAGLRSVAAASAVPAYWDRLAVYWQLAARHGLPISTLMRAAHSDIVDRQRFDDRVQAGLAGARATAAILAGLPVLGVLLGHLLGAHPIRFLLGGGLGGWLLVGGVGLVCAGIAWADRIIDRVAS